MVNSGSSGDYGYRKCDGGGGGGGGTLVTPSSSETPNCQYPNSMT